MNPNDPEDGREVTRAEIDRTTGPVLLEFGAGWCPICKGTAPAIAAELDAHPGVLHIKVEDGPGRPLGRSFRVKLWPTLVFLRDGRVVGVAVRPRAKEIREGLDSISSPG